MAETITIWLETRHHPAFRCGGWAFVRKDAAGLNGAAGGQRSVTPERALLSAVIETLAGVPGNAVEIHTADAQIARLPRRIAEFAAGKDPPTENLDLWAQVATALQTVSIIPATLETATPTAFAAAWADLAQDKAKASGTFRSAIPKPNLAKSGA